MYFMMICTWDPKDEKEVRTRRATWEWPEDVKVISEFYDLQGCRTIYVVETDAKGLIAARAAWIDVLDRRGKSRNTIRRSNWRNEGAADEISCGVVFISYVRKEEGYHVQT